MSERSFRFSHAITRGLRAVDTGTPDLSVMLANHRDYIAALDMARRADHCTGRRPDRCTDRRAGRIAIFSASP